MFLQALFRFEIFQMFWIFWCLVPISVDHVAVIMAYNNITIGLIKKPLLPPATKLGRDYAFTRVCDSVHGGVSLSVLVGSLSWGLSVWGVSTWGLCPGGSLSREVSVQGGLCPEGSLSWGDLCHGDPRMVTSGRYPSYWNAFVLIIMILFYNEYYWF